MSDAPEKIDELNTSSLGRKLSLARASFVAGSRWAASSAGNMFASGDAKEERRKQINSEQAQYLVSEMGKLKGSVVKIGQMMALYGEHFLPPEVTEALHTLNNEAAPIAWPVIERQLRTELGNRLDELTVDPQPLGSASLAQVHRAVRKSNGQELVLKVQYPGIADAIDSDLSLFRTLIKMSRAVPQTREFEDWFDEVRSMMHREVDYGLESQTMQRFAKRLAHDARYVVPAVQADLSTNRVLCMTFERGVPINSPVMLSLPQARRDALGQASLEITIREIFEWGDMQTDPNFGNYLVRLGNGRDIGDKIVLLDFGAIREFDSHLLNVARGLIYAGYHHSMPHMLSAMKGYDFFDQMPENVKPSLAKVFLMATEPFSTPHNNPEAPPQSFDDKSWYVWKSSQLHTRVMTQMKDSAMSAYFSVPPKEFMFISRKFIGAYTFLTVIDAHTNVRAMVEPYFTDIKPVI